MKSVKIKRIAVVPIAKVLSITALLAGSIVGTIWGLISTPSYSSAEMNGVVISRSFSFDGLLSGVFWSVALFVFQFMMIVLIVIVALLVFNFVCKRTGGIEIEIEGEEN